MMHDARKHGSKQETSPLGERAKKHDQRLLSTQPEQVNLKNEYREDWIRTRSRTSGSLSWICLTISLQRDLANVSQSGEQEWRQKPRACHCLLLIFLNGRKSLLPFGKDPSKLIWRDSDAAGAVKEFWIIHKQEPRMTSPPRTRPKIDGESSIGYVCRIAHPLVRGNIERWRWILGQMWPHLRDWPKRY